MTKIILFTLSIIFLSACAGSPLLVPHEDTKKAAQTKKEAKDPARKELEVPPSLREEVNLPTVDEPAMGGSAKVDTRVVGDAVSLEARLYSNSVSSVFSAVIDGMTSLNQPIQSVDSGSGTITTDWVRSDANTASIGASAIRGIFGEGRKVVRYRYVVRVVPDGDKSRMEVRSLGQVFQNQHWVNKKLKQIVTDQMFEATEKRLGEQ